MPTLPKSETESKTANATSLSVSVLIGEKLPVVTTLSGYVLEKSGWMVCAKNTYTKNGAKIYYDGYQWHYKNRIIEFLQDID